MKFHRCLRNLVDPEDIPDVEGRLKLVLRTGLDMIVLT